LNVESKTIVIGNLEIPIKTDLREDELREIIALVEGKIKESSKIIDRKKQLTIVAMTLAGECLKLQKELEEKEILCLTLEEKIDVITSTLCEI
jgi:cell division protein ZapA (FtsZ GTPase activity inhibitor)